MIIRPFTKADARECCSVINAIITANTALEASTRFYLLSNNVPFEFYNNIKDDYALVAELHDQIVAVGSLKNDEIHTLHVSPDYQGMGIGEALLVSLEAEAQARGIEILKVEAPSESLAFYKQFGYHQLRKSHQKIGLTTVDVFGLAKKVAKPAGV